MPRTSGPVCISVINMKGGVGKTTIAALLARYASRTLGLNVLAVDLDPQANLSQAFMRDGYKRFLRDQAPSIVEIFGGHQPPTSKSAAPNTLDIGDIVISNTPLGGPGLRVIPSRFDFADNLMSSIGADPRVLANVIANNFQDMDIVIIDCAPTESIFTRVAYHASRYVLVPVRPEFFATIGFPLLNDSLDAFRSSNRGHVIDVAGIVINNSSYHFSGNRGGPERERSIGEIGKQAKENGWFIFENQIPFSRGFPKMMRGDFKHIGDADLFFHFASEFFQGLEIQKEGA